MLIMYFEVDVLLSGLHTYIHTYTRLLPAALLLPPSMNEISRPRILRGEKTVMVAKKGVPTFATGGRFKFVPHKRRPNHTMMSSTHYAVSISHPFIGNRCAKGLIDNFVSSRREGGGGV